MGDAHVMRITVIQSNFNNLSFTGFENGTTGSPSLQLSTSTVAEPGASDIAASYCPTTVPCPSASRCHTESRVHG